MASRMICRRAASVVSDLRACALSQRRGVANAAAQVAKQPLEQQQQQRRGPRRDVTPFLPFGIFDLGNIWEPVTSNRSMRQMLDTIDRFVDVPAAGLEGATRPVRGGMRTPWDIVEKPDAFYMRVDMPGLDKSEVNISVEDEELVIRGEHKPEQSKEDIFGDSSRNYSTRMILPKEVEKDNIKAELKNGVLTVVVPKLKPEAKKVTQIQVS